MADSMSPLLSDKRRTKDADIETQPSTSPSPSLRNDRFTRRTLPAILLVLGLWLLFRSVFVFQHHYCPHKGLREWEDEKNVTLVPLEAHIMSKCPDAKDCLNKLVVPSMVEISDKVNFTLSYIGR